MITVLQQTIDKVQSLKNTSSDIADSIKNLTDELNSIKIMISPVNINASGNASTKISVMGAMTQCSFGIMPGSYMSIRVTTLTSSMPSSNITDSKIGVNILPFGGCSSPTNPTMNPFVFPWVCIPTLTPFIPTNPTMLLEEAPVTTSNSKAMCSFAAGGVVSFTTPGQFNAKTS